MSLLVNSILCLLLSGGLSLFYIWLYVDSDQFYMLCCSIDILNIHSAGNFDWPNLVDTVVRFKYWVEFNLTCCILWDHKHYPIGRTRLNLSWFLQVFPDYCFIDLSFGFCNIFWLVTCSINLEKSNPYQRAIHIVRSDKRNDICAILFLQSTNLVFSTRKNTPVAFVSALWPPLYNLRSEMITYMTQKVKTTFLT